MRRMSIYLALLILPHGQLCIGVGCTTQSSIDARQASYDVQRVKDGVHQDMFDAVSLLLATSSEEQEKLASYRARLTEWDRDYELANMKKAVTVDAYLFAQIGFFNWLGEWLGITTQQAIKAWDDAQPASRPALE